MVGGLYFKAKFMGTAGKRRPSKDGTAYDYLKLVADEAAPK
jgi:hypothetical protein